LTQVPAVNDAYWFYDDKNLTDRIDVAARILVGEADSGIYQVELPVHLDSPAPVAGFTVARPVWRMRGGVVWAGPGDLLAFRIAAANGSVPGTGSGALQSPWLSFAEWSALGVIDAEGRIHPAASLTPEQIETVNLLPPGHYVLETSIDRSELPETPATAAIAVTRAAKPTPTPTTPSPAPSSPSATPTPPTPTPTPTPKPATPVRVKAAQRLVTVEAGRRVHVPAAGYAADGRSLKLDFASTRPWVATVDRHGVVKAKHPGQTWIRFGVAGGPVKRYLVKVVARAARVNPIAVYLRNVPKAAMRPGEVKYLTGAYYPKSVAKAVVKYRSSNPRIAAIDAAGRLVAIAPGKTRITAQVGRTKTVHRVTVQR
jgi:hypothetical protein